MSERSAGRRSRAANGEGSIYQSADGRWHGWVTVGVKPNGAPDRRHRQAKSRREVVTKIRELERARDAGVLSDAGRDMTLADWLTRWLRDTAPQHLRPKSLASYGTDIRKHLIPGLGQHRLRLLMPAHIETFYARMQRETATRSDGTVRPKYRPATIDHVHRTLRRALNDAVHTGLIGTNPATRVRRTPLQVAQVSDNTIEPLDINDARAIIEVAARRRNGARFIIALSHGLRQGEALGLQWSRVRFDAEVPHLVIKEQLQQLPWRHGCGEPLDDESWPCRGRRGADCPARHSGGLTLTPVKSRKGERHLALDPVTLDLLRTHQEQQQREREHAGCMWRDNDFVFTQRDGRPIGPKADHAEWRDLLREAGVRPARLHDARHTAATFLLVQGVDPRVVMDLMGWSSAVMLQRYQHVISDLRKDAAQRMASYLHSAKR